MSFKIEINILICLNYYVGISRGTDKGRHLTERVRNWIDLWPHQCVMVQWKVFISQISSIIWLSMKWLYHRTMLFLFCFCLRLWNILVDRYILRGCQWTVSTISTHFPLWAVAFFCRMKNVKPFCFVVFFKYLGF